jgi:tetratricopeptide (TPR) repeat protein
MAGRQTAALGGVVAWACAIAGEARADEAASPDGFALALDIAIREVTADDVTTGTPLVLDAARRFFAFPSPDPRDALSLARVAAEVGALTIAEELLERANRHTFEIIGIAGAIDTTRRRTGLPRHADLLGVAPEEEPAYVRAYRDMATAALDEHRLAVFVERYRDLPGARLLLCERDIRAGRFAAAERNCRLAVSAYDEFARGHHWLGVLAERRGRNAEAETALRRAVLLDPEDPLFWRELGRFYQRTRNAEKLRQLAVEWRAIAGAVAQAPGREPDRLKVDEQTARTRQRCPECVGSVIPKGPDRTSPTAFATGGTGIADPASRLIP